MGADRTSAMVLNSPDDEPMPESMPCRVMHVSTRSGGSSRGGVDMRSLPLMSPLDSALDGLQF